MKRVTGLGGIFFKCDDVDKMRAWYEQHLGITPDPSFGGWIFHWRDYEKPDETGYTVWSPFKSDTDYFAPSTRPYMVNYRVDDLDALLAALRQEGVWIDDKREEGDFGRFAWIMDPEGNRIELWEPPKKAGDQSV